MKLFVILFIVPFLGPFSIKPLEEAGFVCPRLKYALRNPLKIADCAQGVIQDGAKNFLDAILRSPIDIPPNPTNMVEGQLLKIEEVAQTPKDALVAGIQKVPHGKYALFFIDGIGLESIKEAFLNQTTPIIFTGKEDTYNLKEWLCEPYQRKTDMCIIGPEHQCNGIETDLVVHVYVAECPMCGISNADPVIISRAKAMLVLSTYQRLQCSCGWTHGHQYFTDDWKTPLNSDEEDNAYNNPTTILHETSEIHSINISDQDSEGDLTPTDLSIVRSGDNQEAQSSPNGNVYQTHQKKIVALILVLLFWIVLLLSVHLNDKGIYSRLYLIPYKNP